MTERIILGIDPGTSVMGYGLIRVEKKKMSFIDMGVIRMEKLPNHAAKLRCIFESMIEIIEKYHPDELAIEAPFFGKNVQSMLKLGRAQGVAIAAAVHRDIPISEYSPKKIKQSITGSGTASKEQVASMLLTLLKLKELPKFLDATDGLAAAVCHYFQSGRVGDTKSYSGWDSFIKKNPDKLK